MENKNIKLTDRQVEILKNQSIDDDNPGTVLRDFRTLVNFIKENEVQLTPKNEFIGMKYLSDLNAALSHPMKHGLQRPFPRSYPNIQGLYMLLRIMGLGQITRKGNKAKLKIDEDILEAWLLLNPVERYFTLLETWLAQENLEILGEYREPNPLRILRIFFERLPEKGLTFTDQNSENRLVYGPDFARLMLLEHFGFVSIQQRKPEKGQSWHLKRVTPTPFGIALHTLLHVRFQQDEDFSLSYFFAQKKIDFGVWQPALQPYFPKWENNLVLPEPVFRGGNYIFKVSLSKDIWRRISIPGKASLHALSQAILDVFDFDEDHMYSFQYKTRFGAAEEVYHPYSNEGGLLADEVLVGDIHLPEGASMLFLYDYGEDWKFDVRLEQVRPAKPRIKHAVILESHGTAPEQYPSDDEGEWGY